MSLMRKLLFFFVPAFLAMSVLAVSLGQARKEIRASEGKIRALEVERDKWRKSYFLMEYEFRKLLESHNEIVASLDR